MWHVISKTLGKHRAAGLILAVALALYVPFLNQAINVDSDSMVHTARQLLENPLDPPLGEYGRRMALHDHTRMPQRSVYYRTAHPPLLSYYLMPAVALAGSRDWVLHLWMALPYLVAVFAGWYLFGLFHSGKQRLLGTLLWAMCPALVVNSHTLMWDVSVTGLMMLALGLYIDGTRNAKPRLVLWSGVMTGLAALTKTNAIPLYVVLGAHLLLQRRWRSMVLWGTPAVMLPMIWVFHNILVYGQIQYLSIGWLDLMPGNLRYRLERSAAYLGGTIWLPLFWHWLMIRRRDLAGLTISIAAALWSFALVQYLDKPVWFALTYWLFAGAGGWIMYRLVRGGAAWGQRASADERTLLSGFALLYLCLVPLLPSASVRYLLPLMPVVILLLLGMLESLRMPNGKVFWALAMPTTLLLALLLSTADYLLAESDRQLPRQLSLRGYNPERTWYYGRLGLDYYMFHAGFRSLRAAESGPRAGDFVIEEIIPGDYPARQLVSDGLYCVTVDTLSFHPFPFRTNGLWAGFYGNTRIPFSIAPGMPQKRFVVYRTVEMIADQH